MVNIIHFATSKSSAALNDLRVMLVLPAVAAALLAFLPLTAAFAAAPIVVNSSADNVTGSNGQCTLREAINNANVDSDSTGGDCATGNGADLITFAPTLAGQTVTLSAGELVISTTLTIQGPGADQLAVSGGDASRVFRITGGQVTLSGLTIRDGFVSAENGGGIFNSGTLLLDHVVVVTNTISGSGTINGGGIYNSGTLTVTHSAIISNANQGSNGRGGGLGNGDGVAVIINSTVSNNHSSTSGGGIYNADLAVLTSTHSTIAANVAVGVQGGGVYIEDFGTSTTFFKSTVLVDNVANSVAQDCYYLLKTPTSLGYNMVENRNNCTFSATGDVTGQAPNLGPLQNNGGQTPTHALLAGSPANDAIPVGVNGCNDTITTDQRDYLRVGPCSIGATEYNGIRLTLTKSINNNTPDPAQTITYTLVISLSPSGNVSVTDLLLNDTLPTGLNFAGPVLAAGGSGGATGAPPILLSGHTLTGGHTVTVTFPVTVNTGLSGGTRLTNSAQVAAAQVTTPVTIGHVLTVSNIPPVAVANVITVSEDSSLTSIDVLTNDYDLNGDAINLSAVGEGDNGGTTGIDAGQATYTPAADFNGVEVFSYTVSDGSLTTIGSVTVTITPVNDAPAFTAGADQWLLQSAGMQTVTGWATGISAGPTDEAGQVFTFTLSNNSPALFTTQPALGSSGELTFSPVATMAGSAVVTAHLRDSGGTADSGRDTSAPQNFVITIVRGDELSTIDSGSGGALAYVNSQRGVSSSVTMAGSAVTNTIRLVYDEQDSTAKEPPTGYRFAGRLFTMQVFSGTALQPDYRFKTPVTLTVTYDPTPQSLNYADETSLEIRRWNGSAWVTTDLPVVNFDPATNQITITLDRPGEFALTGQAPVLGIAKRAAFRSGVPLPGSVVIYTVTLSNAGILTATNVVISDALPAGVLFEAWIVQGGADYITAKHAINWGAQDIQPFTPITIAFTTRIVPSAVFSNTAMTNTVIYSSANGGRGSAAAGFVTTDYYPKLFPVIFKGDE
jgi:uncharacterized repeat protein (TIGR01451 family)/CSLREA domain-containing protein